MGGGQRDVSKLTERERQVLRRLLVGHDAKSTSRELAISVHTVNERLRSARQKLGVSSSRAAARLLAEQGADCPNSLGCDDFGVELPRVDEVHRRVPDGRGPDARPPLLGAWTGPLMIAIAILGAAAMIARSNSAPATPSPAAPPRVVAVQPSPGSAVSAGPLTIAVTYDRPMRPGNYSFVQRDPATYPQCGDNRPSQSADGRTFILRCTVQPRRDYEIWFNSEPFMNFKSLDGIPATAFQLRFRSR